MRRWYGTHKPDRKKPVFLGGAALGVVLVVAALAMIVIPTGAAGSANKTLGCTTIGPQPATAGTSVPFILHLCNDQTSPNQLGSAQVTAPSGFVITGVSPLPTGSSITSQTTVLLMNLNLQPGQSMDITITATTPALCADPGNLQWAIDARQSNNFSGQPGNKFSPDPAFRHQSIAGSCKLAFVNQPGETARTTAARTTKWGAIGGLGGQGAGDPIKVEVQAGGVHYSSPTGSVTIAASGPNCGFTGDATANVPFINGYATFSNLKMANAAASCTLTATSDSGYIASDPSTPFSVDPVQLFFTDEPATAVVNTVVTDITYGGTVNPVQGDPITVGVEATDGTNTLAFNGSGTVTMTAGQAAGGTGSCAFTSGSTTSMAFSGAVASFSNLKMANAPVTKCELVATSSTPPSYDSATSGPFNVDQNGTICSGACDTGPIASGDGNTTEVQANFTGTITVNFTPAGTPIPSGVLNACGTAFQNSPGAGAATSEVILNPTSFSGIGPNASVVVNVAKKYLPKPPSQGNPFIPICAGAHRVALAGNIFEPFGTVFPCASDPNGPGWTTQSYQPALCPADGGGEFWGPLGAYNQNPRIPADSPVITSWTGNPDGSRTFTISLGTVQLGQNWYWDWHSQPA
jgi:hypothetical protein